ncbi:hypothetical protein ACJX0J_023279, partial [Zea mays]
YCFIQNTTIIVHQSLIWWQGRGGSAQGGRGYGGRGRGRMGGLVVSIMHLQSFIFMLLKFDVYSVFGYLSMISVRSLCRFMF